MEVHYELTEEDVIAFNLYHIQNSKTGKNSLRWQRYVSPVIFLLFAYFLSVYSDMQLSLLLPIFGVTAVIWVLFYPKYFYYHITRQVRKMLKEGTNSGLVGSHVLKMTKSGITDQSSAAETSVQWNGITQVAEDAQYVFIYTSTVSAYILPKRDIYSLDNLKSFIETNRKK